MSIIHFLAFSYIIYNIYVTFFLFKAKFNVVDVENAKKLKILDSKADMRDESSYLPREE